MGRLIKIQDIDEFSEIKTIPYAAINTEILTNIRNLDEKSEMERFLREILYDPNETPHGPMEIADILTSHVHVRGNKRLAAFVLKGKSFSRVSSRDVTHQFVKLRQIQGLGLMVFGALGNVQDDAQRDFVQIAIDAGCDYLLIDAQDLARLFIAYEKVCPKDGTPYDDTGTCKKGHLRDKGVTLEMEVREKIRYTIVKQKDVSHAGAKRYSAIVLLDRHYPKDVIRTIIQEATEKLRYSNYYRNERVRARWGRTPAHVVWLFIAYDLEDIQNANWICRTCWIDPSLPKDMHPLSLNGNEKLGDIEVFWNDEYKSHKDFFESHFGTKEEVLEAIRPILNEMIKLAREAINYFEKYRREEISEDELILKMQEMEPRVTELYLQSGNIPMPPEDCKDYDQACQNIFATIHDMFLYFSKRGSERWPKQNRDWLMQDTIKRFYNDMERIRFEESRIH
ncbi:MAG TPA: hypothetical protein ENI33_03950 [Thermoplasmatales archaeon]|nr:hypothetical protein [Thermoplasmatales archaeon]